MVFKTIAENVQSFFQKEDNLEQEPKKVPDAAMELFEKPINKEHGIVAHHLPTEKPTPKPTEKPTPTVRPKLPFSSEQLKKQLVQPRSEPVQPVAQPSPESFTTEEDISSAIAEFEEAINEVPGEDGSSVPLSESVTPERTQSSLPQGEAYFDQLAERLREQGYDENALQNALEAMKVHHAERAVVAEQRSQNEALEQELAQKLAELQSLERDWASKRDHVSASQNRMAELEGAISAKTDELKDLVASIRETPALPSPEPAPIEPSTVSTTVAATTSQSIPQPRYPVKKNVPAPFILFDGSELKSLPELRESLLNMSDATFYHHVTPNRNDFSAWIRDEMGDPALAEKVFHVSSKYELAKLLH